MPVTCIWCAWSDSQKKRREAYHQHLWYTINVAIRNIEQLDRMSLQAKNSAPMSDVIYTILLAKIQDLSSSLDTAMNRFDPKLLSHVAPHCTPPASSVSVICDGTKIPEYHHILDRIIPSQYLRFYSEGYYQPYAPNKNINIEQCTGKNFINIIIKHRDKEHAFSMHCNTVEELNVYLRIIGTTIAALYAHPYIK